MKLYHYSKAHYSTALIFSILAISTNASAIPVTTGLRLWLDATDSNTLADSAGQHPGAAGFNGSIATWDDKSGFNLIASASSSHSPNYNATGFNNSPTLTFNGNQYFSLNSTISTTEESIFIVTRMFDNGDSRGPWIGYIGANGGLINDKDRYYLYSPHAFTGYFLGNYPAPTINSIVAEIRSPMITGTDIYQNGVQVAGSPRFTANAALETNAIGGYGSLSASFFGNISEILMYDRPLTSDEANQVGGYLADKYGLETAYPDLPSQVPEPNNLLMMGLGLVTLGKFTQVKMKNQKKVK